ncbi:hypothetical protein AQJ46_36775 [Streptomyces canus]|uniref:Uncharacterized protein n=1 Tax=Streptomyces canus TaxID=58343 RepID=A0A117QYL6_9ACTN|nr:MULTISPECIES: hypothetical protein [Streptomyces]KUN61406.1 hypothetical protein AQJ46_36775 [Streptomyces canus]MDI5904324.1 hypothetical protein [Streptomyces sp. 12257]
MAPHTPVTPPRRTEPTASAAAGELVVAPVTITPTKPLTPTHVKGLLWTDVLVKASARVGGVRLVWNNRMATVTTQATAFWHHLDLTEPDTDWSRESDIRIGERYVRFHAERRDTDLRDTDRRALGDYLTRADREGWIHPAGRRMLDLWRAQLDQLGVADLGLAADRPLTTTAQTMLDALADRGLLVDHRRFGGPVHLDGPRWGLPLRRLIGGDGHPNYLLPILRELVPLIRPGRLFLLVHDDDIAADYLLLDRVLTEFGARTARLPLSRVPVGGAPRSSRYGGWQGTTLGDLAATEGTADRAAYRLGMRLYFTGTLHRRSAQPFRMPLLRRCVGRAARLLGQTPADGTSGSAPSLAATLSLLRTQQGYVDPYRLTAALLGRRSGPPAPELRAIYT